MEDTARRVFGDSTIRINNQTTRQIKGSLITHPDLLTWFAFITPRNWRHAVDRDITNLMDVSRVMVRRMPTQNEMDALVEHSSRRTYMNRIAVLPSLTVWGMWCVNTWKTRGLLDPLSKLRGGKWGLGEVKDAVTLVRHAAAAQQGVGRMLIVTPLMRLFLLVPLVVSFGSVYAGSVQTKAMLEDARLSELRSLVKGQSPEEFRQRKAELVNEMYRRRVAGKQQQQQGTDVQQGSDAAVGQEPGFYGSSEPDQMSSMDSAAFAGTMNGDIPQAQTQPERNVKQVNEPLSQPTTQGDSGDFFDDASPTASEYKNEGPNQSIQGSAWDRIRQQNMGSGGPPARQDNSQGRMQMEEQNNTADYASEKERDREQARVEFDRLLESERNMSTDSPNGGSKGWGGR